MVHLQGLEPWTLAYAKHILPIRRWYNKSAQQAELNKKQPTRMANSESVAEYVSIFNVGKIKTCLILWCTSRDSNPGPTD